MLDRQPPPIVPRTIGALRHTILIGESVGGLIHGISFHLGCRGRESNSHDLAVEGF